MVSNMAGWNKAENMMTSFPLFDAFHFFSRLARPIRIYMLSLILNENLRQF